ncbi:MAG: hypothetical protein R3335_09275 [Anaerolineales bacterium]|nr:hypothetical protein [Anaerolineales bacterium]
MDETTPERSDAEAAYQKALAVKNSYKQELMAKPNVVGVGVGLKQKDDIFTDIVAIIVMVSRKITTAQLDPESLIPLEIEGVPVDVQEVGELRAQ